ncbi:Hsp70 family protein [Amycolatopsis thermophila]|uniref:Molecular chaperone DnaK (HSP70) n=1 Tax=Amycolatopsis thermophila TaxID=206084 RepID=A0ABU0ESC7_9PSEU|nr:Hsp70 family protein [Amycolatopsis thermophila]MDQ0377901.1 molecular chaperone DnaK (HSP70) [Amycolatopsis thermophila]
MSEDSTPMRHVLGIDIGSTGIAAAVCRDVGERWSEPVVVPPVEAVVHVAGDATVSVGAEALRQSVTEPDRVARGFVRRIGDDVPFLLGDELYTPEALTAAVAGWVVDQVAADEGEPAERIAVTHPPSWGVYRRKLLLDALGAAGLPPAMLLPAPVAAAEGHLARERVDPQTVLGVCRIGGEHADLAVLRRGPSTFDLVTHAEPAEPAAGKVLDDLLFDHVRERCGDVAPSALRLVCTEAKERLSTLPETDLGPVRVTRAEFERLVRPALLATLEPLRRYERLNGVLLVGGTAAVPLVAHLVAELTGCRVVTEPEPATAVARGAALVARLAEGAAVESTALVPKVTGFPDLEPDDLYDDEPVPPRPPVVLTPLEPPRRRFVPSRRGGSRSEDDE